MKQATIVFCLRGDDILLGMKKQGFGVGKWNGFGGKVKDGETIAEAAARELQEEAGINADPNDLAQVAQLEFWFADTPIFEAHVFTVHSWRGEPAESDEMRPQWFSHADIPWDTMWSDDPIWLPEVLAGRTVKGVFRFDEAGEIVLAHQLDDAMFT